MSLILTDLKLVWDRLHEWQKFTPGSAEWEKQVNDTQLLTAVVFQRLFGRGPAGVPSPVIA